MESRTDKASLKLKLMLTLKKGSKESDIGLLFDLSE
jgi:hypothetical protein